MGGAPLAVEARGVEAVALADGILPVPFARRCIRGILVRQGRVVPVIDPAAVPALWNQVPRRGGRHVLVLAAGEIEAGLLADEIEAFTGEEGGGGRPPSMVREAILWGVTGARGRVFGLLRVEALLAAAGMPPG
jgi:chemotaxis signal transduction protein